MADPTLAEQIAWLRLEIQRREINNIRGVGDADLSMVRSILKGLEGMAAPGDTMEQAREDACIKRIGDLYMDGTIPEWAAEQLDELHRAALTAARRAAIEPIVKALDLEGPAHARHNLDGALIDLDSQEADRVCRNTIRRVVSQLAEVERAFAAAPPREGSNPSGITE